MVYILIARQELRTIKIGRARRVPESAVEQWIAQQLDTQQGQPHS
jgi:excisionase family DNA binding protein